VLAPAGAGAGHVERILRRRFPWIRRQRRELEALPQPLAPRRWVAGETHRFLGRQYRLKLVVGSMRSVRLVGAYFVVTAPEIADRQIIKRLMEEWYRAHAQRLVEERARRLLASTTWLEVTELPLIRIRVLSQRWGSTTKSGRIWFNLDVVKLPAGCLDYVVAHELVHLRKPDHSQAFWRMLSRVMPDWKKWRGRLARVEV